MQLKQFLAAQDYIQLYTNYLVFIKPLKSSEKDNEVIISIYINDILIMSLNKDSVKAVKHSLNNKFNITDLDECTYYLNT